MSAPAICPTCNNTRAVSRPYIAGVVDVSHPCRDCTCERCGGCGWLTYPLNDTCGAMSAKCPACKGTGVKS